MGLGAGHVQDMNNRMKRNRAQRPSNKSKFKKSNRNTKYSSENKIEKLMFKTIPENELIKSKKYIRKKAKIRRIREGIILGIILLTLFFMIITFMI